MLIDVGTMRDVTIDGGFLSGAASSSNKIVTANTKVVLANGVRNFIDGINKYFPTPKRKGSSSGVASESWGNFYYSENWTDMIELFTKNANSLVKFQPKELDITDYYEQGNDVEFDVTGDYIDMGKFVEGVPEVFGALHNGNARNRRVRLVLNFGNAVGVSEKDTIIVSERITRLIDSLEKAHVRSEMTAIEVSECSYTEVIVKQFNDGLNIQDVAIASNPDFLRRLAFRCIEWSDTYQDGYGSSLWLTQRRELLKSTTNDELTIFIDSNLEGNSTIHKRFDELEKQLIDEINQIVPKKSLFVLDRYEVTNMDF